MRLLALALALSGLVAVTPAEAETTYALDGRHRKVAEYAAKLDTPMYPVFPNIPNYVSPSPDHCVAGSCDKKLLRLSLPPGRSWGRFHAKVTLPPSLQAAVFLYDSRRKEVRGDELIRRPHPDRVSCCDDPGYYTLELSHPMLPRGTYTLLIVNRAGGGMFDARVEWVANPPDRPLTR